MHIKINACPVHTQTSSMETTVDVLSVIASTFANGGICPITGKKNWDTYAYKSPLIYH